ncbi:hypothetical protein [Amycolatopsis sp. NPDC059021]|uniref:hypothetical protein n=1 Tax=Amycolatopsis sp. NPDC059021 TaxID=3346704 RepID=UPI00366E9B20
MDNVDNVDNVTTLPAERELTRHRPAAEVVDAWSTRDIGPFRVTAVDGLGDPQPNWVVQADGQRVFHGGDTMFNGYSRRTSSARTPDNAPMCCPSGNGWTCPLRRKPGLTSR